MSRYPHGYTAEQGPCAGSAESNPRSNAHHNDRSSQSPTVDTTGYAAYSKSDIELEEEEPNNSLISQTLNTDGTPKRPMNAFMIFARRRRPQVSTENQSMRTGEISKILSKEWNAMELADKQFYLDQAKQLKDTFNSKYPDYVYRRRPNNSRRKRGSLVSGMKPLDHHSSTDPGDDSGRADYDDVSPVDGGDLLGAQPNVGYSRPPPDASVYDAPHHPRSTSYNHGSSDVNYRQSHGRDPYTSSRGRGAPDISLEATRFSQPLRSSHQYQQYPHAQDQNHSPPLYTTQHGSWEEPTSASNRAEHPRASPGSWASGNDRILPSLVSDRPRVYAASTGPATWARNTPPEPPRSASPGYPFPALNAPFYPGSSQSHSQYAASSTSLNSSAYHASSHDPPRSIQPSGAQSGHDRGYDASPRISSPYPQISSRPSPAYHQHAQHLPLLQPTHPESGDSSSTSPSTDASSYWSREHNR
ncbi:hypothetical protein FIBSPDRAFT_925446 [Athelia psychrophila]|uniref:HMG box domain-containing protein n=1 Tax=Athelia psychrophila TaxID=1759441 RepID=A0A166UUC6_9AGAM|nr:hypothetical protein FIBSPDRAFT_925446 [Fibularhizoctonia sp. CBS 109695]